MNEVFERLKGLTGYGGEAAYGPAKAGEVYRIYLDSAKARRELGWEPRLGLEEGLRDTVQYFREQLARRA